MKKSVFSPLLLLAVFFFSSCEKEPAMASAELTAQELQKFVDRNYLSYAEVYFIKMVSGTEVNARVENRVGFRIEAPYLVSIDSGTRYHLDRLVYFTMLNNQNQKILQIYFK